MHYSEFQILMGLPGSGKTYFVKNVLNEDEFEKIYLDDYKKDERLKMLRQTLSYPWNHNKKVVIDGLILTKDDLFKIANKISCCMNKDTKIFIHIWNEDREACIKNDEYRFNAGMRELLAANTIKKAPYNPPSFKEIQDMFNEICGYIPYIEIINHKVYKTSEIEGFMLKYANSGYPNYTATNEIRSESWSCGGECGNCWNDNMSTIYPDEQPKSFEKFDEILENLCPNISFLQYKKLYNELVTIESYEKRYYYGGYENFQYYKCNKDKLIERLKEMNLIS